MMAFDNLKKGTYTLSSWYSRDTPAKTAIVTFADKRAISIDVEGLTV